MNAVGKNGNRTWPAAVALAAAAIALTAAVLRAGVPTPVPPDQRGSHFYERSGQHDASNIRTVYWNYGMVGDYPPNPGNVDLSTFHSVEVPRGSGMNYSDGITPFVLARVIQRDGTEAYIMETGFRERQLVSARYNRQTRFEPRPGYFQADPLRNSARAPAISSDRRTWPEFWPDRLDVAAPDTAGWPGRWNGYFGKRIVADQESYSVMDDQYYDTFDFYPDSRDSTRRGLGLRVEVRGFQWSNPQARNVVFWHYDITNEGTTHYIDNIIFGLYMDSGVGGSAISCDGVYESDDDNAFFTRTFNDQPINLVYTWDLYGHGRDLNGGCSRTGYLGYAYLETPGDATDRVDNDLDGITDERREGGPGQLITGQDNITAYVNSHYDVAHFVEAYGPIEQRPAYRAVVSGVPGYWWTGDEDMDWLPDVHDLGADGDPGSHDQGEGDGQPTAGEPNFDATDLNESDQIGLTGFKINRIAPGRGNEGAPVDGVLFFTGDGTDWPRRLYDQFSSTDPNVRFGPGLATNYNIGFLFASGPFSLVAGQSERFSLSLAFGADLAELRRTVQTVQTIYNANYRFAVPPTVPVVTAETGDGFVRLSWNDVAERSVDPTTGEHDFEGYRIYRSTDPDFLDPQVIVTGTGSGPIYNGRPIAQYDLIDGISGYSELATEGVQYYLGTESGLTHTWTDYSVTNGQQYYYGVCAYDYGATAPLNFPPSENSLGVHYSPRGGVILEPNIVSVRPNPRAAGFRGASADTATHVAGRSAGRVRAQVVNSDAVPDDHLFALTFATPSPDSLHAATYILTDSTAHRVLLKFGRDFHAQGIGATGGGLLPLVSSPDSVTIYQARTGLRAGSPSDARLSVTPRYDLNPNRLRPGYPDDVSIEFADAFVDTAVAYSGSFPDAAPAKFRVIAHSPGGDQRLKFRFRDWGVDGRRNTHDAGEGDGTIDAVGEEIDVVTYAAEQPDIPKSTWRVAISAAPTRAPAAGDTLDIVLKRPLMAEDVFTFTTHGQRIDAAAADSAFAPYVVPNPYVGSASFEPKLLAISGRGERRIEFRGLPANCTIRIFNVRGDLVQTLRHETGVSGYTGYQPWNLRTKDNLDLAPGLYVFQVDGGGLGKKTGKFAVVK